MKYLFLLLVFSTTLFGFNRGESCEGEQELSKEIILRSDDPEIATLEDLVFTTKKNLQSQKQLLQNLTDFKETRKAFLVEPTSGKLATKLVRLSMRLSKQLDEDHLAHLFSSDFLNEIKFFNQIGESQNIARE